MNKNTARRCLRDINVLYRSQVWIGPPYWLVRTRLWNAADLPIPQRIEMRETPKSKLDKAVRDNAVGGSSGIILEGRFHAKGYSDKDVVAIAPTMRKWQAICFDPSYFYGLQEIVHGTGTKVVNRRLDLNHQTVSWWDGKTGQPLAILMALMGQPQETVAEEAAAA